VPEDFRAGVLAWQGEGVPVEQAAVWRRYLDHMPLSGRPAGYALVDNRLCHLDISPAAGLRPTPA
jgi:hypothetical protein